MYDYKIALSYKDILGAESQPVKTSAKNASLTDIFKGIDDKYKTSDTAKGLGLEKLQYTPPTDIEIEQAAKDSLSAIYASNQKKIEQAAEEGYNSLSAQKQSALSGFEEGASKIDSYYDTRKASAEKDALKRGLARSSVISGKIEEFDKGRIDNKTALLSELNAKAEELDSEIIGLEGKKQNALADYELSYAAEIAEKINALKKERDEKLAEVLKYNNTVQEKEKKYADSLASAQNSQDEAAMIREEKLAAAKKYYDTLNKEQALSDFLGDPSMKTQLGAYYSYMLNYLNNRK